MHVALVTMNGNRHFSGGVPAVVLERARYLCERGHDVSIVCRAEKGFDRPEDRDGVHVYPVRTHRIAKAVFARLQSASPLFLHALRGGLAAAHRRRPIDLVDLQDGPAILGVGPFVRAHAIPMTFTLHGSAAVNPGKRPWIGRKLHIAYEKSAYRHATRVLAVSHFIARTPRLLGFGDVPTVVVPNTIDESFLHLPRDNTPGTGPLRIVFVGRIVPEKRLDTALRAMAALPRDRFHLDIIGDGPDRAAMVALASRLGVDDSITWHGYVSDRNAVRVLLARSDVFLFPTIYEAHPIALLEALAAGLFPVVSDIPVSSETVPAEYQVAADDAAAFAARLSEIAADPSILTDREAALRAIAAGFRRATIYPQLLAEYEATIAGKVSR